MNESQHFYKLMEKSEVISGVWKPIEVLERLEYFFIDDTILAARNISAKYIPYIQGWDSTVEASNLSSAVRALLWLIHRKTTQDSGLLQSSE
jgi:hypothetical protein